MLEALSAYELMTALLSLLWLALFLYERPLRTEMVLLGLFGLFLLPLSFSVLDGSSTTYGLGLLTVSDLAFTFSVSGIAGVIFHAVLGKDYHLLPTKKQKVHADSVAQWWIVRLLLAFLFFVWITLLLTLAFDLTLAASVLISAVMLTIYIVSHRHDLLLDALASAALVGFLVYLAGELAAFFTGFPISLSFIDAPGSIGAVPTDLLLWSLGVGLVLGPLYEYIRRFELK